VSVVASLLMLAHQAYNPPVHVVGRKRGTDIFRPRTDEHPDDESWPGLLILRIEGRAFFLNVQYIVDKIWDAVDDTKPTVVLLDGRSMIDIEYTALKRLIETEEELQREGISLWLAALTPQALTVVQTSGLGDKLGPQRLFMSLHSAVRHYEAQIAT